MFKHVPNRRNYSWLVPFNFNYSETDSAPLDTWKYSSQLDAILLLRNNYYCVIVRTAWKKYIASL